MDLEIREIDCAKLQELLRTYPDEMAVIVEMLQELDELPCQDIAA